MKDENKMEVIVKTPDSFTKCMPDRLLFAYMMQTAIKNPLKFFRLISDHPDVSAGHRAIDSRKNMTAVILNGDILGIGESHVHIFIQDEVHALVKSPELTASYTGLYIENVEESVGEYMIEIILFRRDGTKQKLSIRVNTDEAVKDE